MSAPLAFRPEPFEMVGENMFEPYEGEEDQFLGKFGRSISRYATRALLRTPLGFAAKAAWGGLTAAAKGQNFFKGAARSLKTDPLLGFVVNVASGENVLRAAKRAAKAGIADVREQLRFAQMVAPFIPGIGTGVAAALGAANALAAGRPITAALVEAARSAIPGGVVAQAAFDVALNLAKGKNLTQAALAAVRGRLPGGPAAKAAFDAAVALSQGKRIQEAALAGVGRFIPPSPYAADALSFARRVAAGESLQRAALSTAGNRVLQRMNRELGEFGRAPFGEMATEFEEERGRVSRPVPRYRKAGGSARGPTPTVRGGGPWRPQGTQPLGLYPRVPWRPSPAWPPDLDRRPNEPTQPSRPEPADTSSGGGGVDASLPQTSPPMAQCQPPLVLAGFDVGSPQLRPRHHAVLARFTKMLGQMLQDAVLTIEGHTDGSPQEMSNKALSQQRALTVAKFIADSGVGVEITTQPLHHTQPIMSGTSQEDRAKNRRVVIRACRRSS